ncbi:MAG TPA: hypothetical protein VH796_17205 [Nitrososphaeraceae archaeon]|jgi:uncharacterized membrane protein
MNKDLNRKYITISMIAVIAALIGTLVAGQVLQPLHAQNTSGQVGQKVGNATGAAANTTGAAANKTGNQSSNPLAKVGEALKSMFSGGKK